MPALTTTASPTASLPAPAGRAPGQTAPAAGPAGTAGFDALRASFTRVPGFLNAATLGLPAHQTLAAMHAALDDWQAGRADLMVYDAAVNTARAAFARLVGAPVERVAVGSHTSVMMGMIASSLPDGSEILVVDGEFTSVTYPFCAHADRGFTVRAVPAEALADAVRPSTAAVVFSPVQSRNGQVIPVAPVTAAARAVGAITVIDTTQAAGWLPMDADAADVMVNSSYKWLAAPRGVGFTVVSAELSSTLKPTAAGWYAGESVWDSVYGHTMELAASARRLDISPAWLSWVGAAAVLPLFAAADPATLAGWGTSLAARFAAGLGIDAGGSAIVSVPDPDGTVRTRMDAAGLQVAGRGGAVRVAFHVWNTEEDVDLALDALR